MATFTAAFTIAGGPYNLFNVIAGVQTTGVTAKTGSKVGIAPSRNYSKVLLQVSSEVAGIVYITSDATANATNKVGFQIASGDSYLWDGEGGMKGIPLPPKYFAPDTNGMVVTINYE